MDICFFGKTFLALVATAVRRSTTYPSNDARVCGDFGFGGGDFIGCVLPLAEARNEVRSTIGGMLLC